MFKRSLILQSLTPLIVFALTLICLFVTKSITASGGGLRGLGSDNVTVTGKVISIGPSTVGNGPSVITYSYDVPGFARNGNPGSFTREQVTSPTALARFHPGMNIPVEYSHASPGTSRMKGFGRGSVFFNEFAFDGRLMRSVLLPCLLIFLVGVIQGRGPFKRKPTV